jgi:hypothetical protein
VRFHLGCEFGKLAGNAPENFGGVALGFRREILFEIAMEANNFFIYSAAELFKDVHGHHLIESKKAPGLVRKKHRGSARNGAGGKGARRRESFSAKTAPREYYRTLCATCKEASCHFLTAGNGGSNDGRPRCADFSAAARSLLRDRDCAPRAGRSWA